MALNIFGQVKCQCENCTDVLPIHALLLKQVMPSVKDHSRNARGKYYLWLSQHMKLILALLLDLHSRRHIAVENKAVVLTRKLLPKYFCGWLLVLQHRFLSRLLTWQCVPFCSRTSGRTMWCNYLQCKCDWTLIKEAFRFEFVLGFQYLAFNFCTNVWNELKYFQYENKICLENFI